MNLNPKYSLMFAIIFFVGGGITWLHYNNLMVGGVWLFFGGIFSAWLFHELWNQALSHSDNLTEDKKQ